MAHKGKMSIEKWVFRGKKGVFELEKNRTSNQTRKAKWCKMQVLLLKMDNEEDEKGYKKVRFTNFLTYFLARMERKLE